MAFFQKSSLLPVPAEDLQGWHFRLGAFERLSPPWAEITAADGDPIPRSGETFAFQVRQSVFSRRWVARFLPHPSDRGFVDEQVAGPFARWKHTHTFAPAEAQQSLLVDEVEYALPFGLAGRLAGAALARRQIERLFGFRHRRTRQDLERHAEFSSRSRMTVAVTGSGGLVGRELCAFLTSGGHTVRRLVRRAPLVKGVTALWNPAAGFLDPEALEGCDAVIHLGGENIAAGNWTPARKVAIRESRIKSTTVLARTLAGMATPPRILVSASAIGYYGSRGQEPLSEEAGAGEGFLAEVCRDWESAADPARQAGIRVVHPRIGMVLSSKGGALNRLLTPFRLGFGGPVGNGLQAVSWIEIDDLVGVIYRMLFDDRLEGPVNATAPAPVANREFARTLGRVLRRPAWAPLPAPLVRLLFGEMGRELLLSSARVLPSRLQASGFRFFSPDLETAFRHALGCA